MSTIHIPFILTILWIHIKTLLPALRPLLIKFNSYAGLENWLSVKSRKLALLYIVIILATGGAFLPPIIVWVLALLGKNVPPLSILGSTEWVSMISLVVTTYFGSNVWEKHVALSNGVMPNQIDDVALLGSQNTVIQQPVQVNVGINQAADPEREALRDALRHGNL